MAIENKDLLVSIKSYSRSNPLPLDSTEVHDSLAAAESYAKTPSAYGGQTIKALVDGKYKTYTLQPTESGYVLIEVGEVTRNDLKKYVQIVDVLPESEQEENVIYITGTIGQVWTGSGWKIVFKEISTEVGEIGEKVQSLEKDMKAKAPISSPDFKTKVSLDGKSLATEEYVGEAVRVLSDEASKTYLPKNQGAENSGKVVGIDSEGNIVPMFPQGFKYDETTGFIKFGYDPKMTLGMDVQLDNTLTKTGYAADAKITGSQIALLKEENAALKASVATDEEAKEYLGV